MRRRRLKSSGLDHRHGQYQDLELCDFSKTQCPDCHFSWGIGIVYCSCGMSNTFAKYQKVGQETLRRLINYRLRHQTKNLHRGAKHGASERQRMYYKAKDMLQKARQPKHGGYNTILEMTKIASLCQKLGGLKNKLFSMTNLHWKITPILQ